MFPIFFSQWYVEVPGPGIKPMSQQWPELLQWQHLYLNLLHHKGTPASTYFYILFHCIWNILPLPDQNKKTKNKKTKKTPKQTSNHFNPVLLVVLLVFLNWHPSSILEVRKEAKDKDSLMYRDFLGGRSGKRLNRMRLEKRIIGINNSMFGLSRAVWGCSQITVGNRDGFLGIYSKKMP